MSQIELHKKIDILLAKNPGEVKQESVSDLIEVNSDARQYFFVKADERWLGWLWQNGFLDMIKKGAGDPTRYEYKTPELDYLVRISVKVPEDVVNIMMKIPVSAERFNPEVVDRFLWICGELPAKQLAQMVKKIRDEEWVQRMSPFNRWGFEYEKMFKTLESAKDYKSILVLAEAILAVRTKKEKEDAIRKVFTDSPFYFSDLSRIKVFEYLTLVDEEYIEQALELSTKIMTEIILLGGKSKSSEVFLIEETIHLLDVDFFTLELGQKQSDDVRELVAVIKSSIKKLIDSKCNRFKFVHGLYERYFLPLPDSRTMWRLRLFVLSLCPNAFKTELKDAFFKLFDVENYYEIISGTEYEKTLQEGFSVLEEDDKREYIKKVVEYFKKKDQEKEDEKQDWYLPRGSRILSMIPNGQIKEDEKKMAEEEGIKLDPKYKPEPSVGMMQGGIVRSHGPVSQKDFGDFTVSEIAKKLRTDWTPEKLSKQNKDGFTLNPLNAEGASEQLHADIPKRPQDYINNVNLFFERGVLDRHYTYSFLRGIQEVLRENKADIGGINWENLINFCITIKKSGEDRSFDTRKRERNTFDAWLVGWTGVHSAMTDVIQELLKGEGGRTILNFDKYREQLLEVLDYLLKYPDPTPEDEKPEIVKERVESSGAVNDPFMMAINTVRGRAFQAFVMFIYQDGKKFKKEDVSKFSSDVKELYETVLEKENTRALMFMFGHYLPSFYFRDKEWIRKLLPKIFPTDPEKKDFYTAAWEGYLSYSIYEEIFFDSDIQELYKRGLALTKEDFPKQKHFKDPNESMATHLALAFMHFKEFDFEHPLFKAFWAGNSKRHVHFNSFIGRSFVSGDNKISNEAIEKEPWIKERIKDFWDWIIENHEGVELFAGFGFWINLEKDIFEPAWLAKRTRETLEKTGGVLDWDYGLNESIIKLAEKAPEDALAITRLYLLEGGVHRKSQRIPFHMGHDDEWLKVFKILHDRPETKSMAYTLIDDLIREGGSAFWELKEIVEDKTN